MRNYGKLVANFGTKSSTYFETIANYVVNLTSQLCGTKQLCQVKENHLPTMRNYAKLAKSSTYYEKLW